MDKLRIEVKNLERLEDKSYYNHNYYRHRKWGYILYVETDELYNCATFCKTDENLISMEYLGLGDWDWEDKEWLEIDYQQR